MATQLIIIPCLSRCGAQASHASTSAQGQKVAAVNTYMEYKIQTVWSNLKICAFISEMSFSIQMVLHSFVCVVLCNPFLGQAEPLKRTTPFFFPKAELSLFVLGNVLGSLIVLGQNLLRDTVQHFFGENTQ